MAKHLQISIPEPCHEDWDKMSPSAKGRFCDSCQKQVVDFSNMTDREIASFFKKPSAGNMCGRFMQDQLQRDIEIPRKRIPWMKYFFQFALPAFLVSLKASAQNKQTAKPNASKQVLSSITINEKACQLTGFVSIAPINLYQQLIKGKIFNEEGAPIPFARAVLKGTSILATADAEGAFEIKIPQKWKDPVLVASASGYDSKDEYINDKSAGHNPLIITLKQPAALKRNEIFMGDTIIITNIPAGRKLSKLNKLPVPLPAVVSAVHDINKPYMNAIKITDNVVKTPVSSAHFIPNTYAGALLIRRSGYREKKQFIPQNKIVKPKPDSLITKITKTMSAAYFKLFPNPVKAGSSMHIAWSQHESGNYSMQLMTEAGQSVFKREIWVDDEARFLDIEIPAVKTGIYFLRMTHLISGMVSTEKVVIE